MDDKEYYEKMRNHNLNHNYSWLPKKDKTPNYSKWRVHEGREDAEMLVEKNTESDEDEK